VSSQDIYSDVCHINNQAWLVDPRKRTLETYDLIDGTWRESGRYSGQDRVRAIPFDAVTLGLGDLWAP